MCSICTGRIPESNLLSYEEEVLWMTTNFKLKKPTYKNRHIVIGIRFNICFDEGDEKSRTISHFFLQNTYTVQLKYMQTANRL